MYLLSIGFLLGNCFVQLLSKLPDLLLVSLIVLITPWYLFQSLRQFGIGFSVGVLWTMWCAQMVINSYLPPDLIGKNIIIQGVVEELPSYQLGIQHFIFKIEQLSTSNEAIDYPKRRVQLSVKMEQPLVHAGEKWQLTARLKPIHGYANPGSFNLEQWAFSQHLVAKGYVLEPKTAKLLAPPSYFYRIQSIRERLGQQISTALLEYDKEAGAVITALAIGTKTELSKNTWQIFRETGTSHLVAISGLHVGLVAGIIAWLTRRGWLLIPRAALWCPAQKIGAMGGLIAAILYSALAGFSVPTQRALLMVLAGVACLLLNRPLFSWNTFCLALLGVMLWDPLATLSMGFWLSFGAVAFILLITSSHLQLPRSWKGNLLTQKAIFVGLLPLTIVFFGGFSLVSPLANAIAIPYVSIIVVPCVLMGVVSTLISSKVAALLWGFAAMAIKGLLIILMCLSKLPYAYLSITSPNMVTVICAVIGTIILVSRCLPLWYLSGVAFLPLFFPANVNISSGNVKIFLLDVGQGLSALVQTEKHTLLYDTGASFPNGGSLAESVIMPFLKTQSIAKIDTLVLSHGDNDHAGGVAVIAENIPLSFVYRNHEAYPHLAAYPQKVCKKGETWGWDGVQFEFLNPWAENPKLKRNDTSCVLRITIGNINVLLTGDIEKNAEQELIDQDINKLASQILVAPHHGSRTSSSEVFIRAVAPQIVLIPAGYRNRYRLPSKQVLQRYDAKHISYLNTAQTGLIEITIKQDQGNYIISTYRAKHKNYWEYL